MNLDIQHSKVLSSDLILSPIHTLQLTLNIRVPGYKNKNCSPLTNHSVFLFEIKRVFVYNSIIFKLTDLFILYFFIQTVYANKKVG